MNLHNPFLIKFLIIFISLEGSMSMDYTIHGFLGSQIILPIYNNSGKPYFIRWTRDSTFIADRASNNIPTAESESKKYHVFPDGSLKINTLEKKDAGSYKVNTYNETGYFQLQQSVTLQVRELLPQPKLTAFCSKRILECEVKFSEKPRFKLFQNTQEIETFQGPVYDNVTWKVTLQLKVLSGKFRCEVDVNSDKTHTEKIICQGINPNLLTHVHICTHILSYEFVCVLHFPHSVPMFLILTITGGVVTLIIFMALIIYCIKKKKAKRHEREAQEHALQVQIEDHMKYRKLPQTPVRSASNPPPQKSMLPPSHSELQQQNGPPPPKSCPHPKPPRRMKERP
ncbi:T-cell surface antigen CD2 [Candoia aspera]|uniref:T-cell surface antigen CD2 n=1 Tax=Candoia aspera TaxID=51853 RepID=UPI002FD80785